MLQASKRITNGSTKIENYKFDQFESRKDMAIMIMKHAYPFAMVEHEYFIKFCKGLNPNFKPPTRNTSRVDCIVVNEEKRGRFIAC